MTKATRRLRKKTMTKATRRLRKKIEEVLEDLRSLEVYLTLVGPEYREHGLISALNAVNYETGLYPYKNCEMAVKVYDHIKENEDLFLPEYGSVYRKFKIRRRVREQLRLLPGESLHPKASPNSFLSIDSIISYLSRHELIPESESDS